MRMQRKSKKTILIILRKTNTEKQENLKIPCKNNANHEIHKISFDNYKNNENIKISIKQSRKL